MRWVVALSTLAVATVLVLAWIGWFDRSPAPAESAVPQPAVETPTVARSRVPAPEAIEAERSSAGEPAPRQADDPGRGSIDGRVSDELGQPIDLPALKVELTAPDGGIVVVPVDAEGRWQLQAIPSGTWELCARAPGHVEERLSLDVLPAPERTRVHVVLRRAERVVVRLETLGGPGDPDELQERLEALAPFLEVRLGEATAVPARARLPSPPHLADWGLRAVFERGSEAAERVDVYLGDVAVASRALSEGTRRDLVIALDPSELHGLLVDIRVRVRAGDGQGTLLRPEEAFLRAPDARWVLAASRPLGPSGELSFEAAPPGPAELVVRLPDGRARRSPLVVPREASDALEVTLGG